MSVKHHQKHPVIPCLFWHTEPFVYFTYRTFSIDKVLGAQIKKQIQIWGAGENLKPKSKLLLLKALYSIGSFSVFASALVWHRVLNLQLSSYVIPHIQQNITPFRGGVITRHMGWKLIRKRKVTPNYGRKELPNLIQFHTCHRKLRQVLDVSQCWHIIFNHAHHKIHFTEIKNTQYKNPLDTNVTH